MEKAEGYVNIPPSPQSPAVRLVGWGPARRPAIDRQRRGHQTAAACYRETACAPFRPGPAQPSSTSTAARPPPPRPTSRPASHRPRSAQAQSAMPPYLSNNYNTVSTRRAGAQRSRYDIGEKLGTVTPAVMGQTVSGPTASSAMTPRSADLEAGRISEARVLPRQFPRSRAMTVEGKIGELGF